MNISVVGNLTAALPLMQQISADSQHRLGPCCLRGPLASAVAQSAGAQSAGAQSAGAQSAGAQSAVAQSAGAQSAMALQLEAEPENAFLSPRVDMVVLAMDEPEAVLQLTRSASQAERHVVVFPPAELSTAFGFELHLLLDESSHAVIPLPGRIRLRSLANSLKQRRIDTCLTPGTRQLVIEVLLSSDDSDELKQQQLQALDLAGALGLRYTQVTAIESRDTSGRLISRLLTLGCSVSSDQVLPPATITLRPAASPAAAGSTSPGITLTLIQVDGTSILLPVDTVAEPLPWIELMSQSRDLNVAAMEALSTALELSDAVDKSLRRRRTVDVYFDSGSERSVFKSQMTAIGCGVLTWTLLGMIGFLMAAQLLQLPDTALQILRFVWILPVVLFLLAQLLLPLSRNRQQRP